MTEKIEMGTVSARGQICIPSRIREEMDLKEGSKILFFLSDNSLLMKKISVQSFEEITKPLKQAAKKAGLKESGVVEMVHKSRRRK